MIAKITRTQEFGKQQFSGINFIPEIKDESPDEFFAHSVQDAMAWAQAFPSFQNGATIDEIGSDRYLVYGIWMPIPFIDLVEDAGLNGATHQRTRLFVQPVNTIYENDGFQRFIPKEH